MIIIKKLSQENRKRAEELKNKIVRMLEYAEFGMLTKDEFLRIMGRIYCDMMACNLRV